jgi:hypothetical protein
MEITMPLEESIECGKQPRTGLSKYRPIAISGSLFLLTGISDILFGAALAEGSALQWFWVSTLIGSFSAFIASLQADCFRLLSYVVDQAGVHLQYEIASGPLETSELVHRTRSWSGITSADYTTQTDEDGSETHDGVVLTVSTPLESGRTKIELKSDCPEQVMRLVHSHISATRRVSRTSGSALAIA